MSLAVAPRAKMPSADTVAAEGKEGSEQNQLSSVSDHILGLELLHILRGEAEPLAIDLGVVLAEQGGAVYLDVRVGHLHRPAGQGELAALRVLDGDDHLA